ncbi:MAG TPA: hypothetical protein VI933_01665 [archaeon]|nr:hypothetical protein [archaeon]
MIDIQKASEKALNFVLHQKDSRGLWSDFPTRSHGDGDDYPTVYTAVSLLESRVDPNVLSQTAAEIARRQDEGGGWGFNRDLAFHDADTTALALMLLKNFRGYEKNIRNARRFLHAHKNTADGGYSTHNDPEALAAVYGVPDGGSFSGWCSSHPDVTATVLQALGRDKSAVNFLVSSQKSEGQWVGYWWIVPSYATAQAILALKGNGNKETLKKGRKWLAENCRNPQQPLPAAFSLIGIGGCLDYKNEADGLARYLVDTQFQDGLQSGSWASYPSMRLPAGDVVDPETDSRMYRSPLTDERGIFTTATCLRALKVYARRIGDS